MTKCIKYIIGTYFLYITIDGWGAVVRPLIRKEFRKRCLDHRVLYGIDTEQRIDHNLR